jgi:GT2 family glycosyltransferase
MAYGEVTYRQSLVRLVGRDELDTGLYDRERDVDWVSGCAILLSGAAIDALGGFDEEFFAYHEEVDWCARARASGWRVVYAPAAVVTHRGEASSGGGSYVSRKQYLAGRNMVLFVRRHGSVGERVRFAAFFLGSLPLQYMRRALEGEQRGVALKLRGARDALRGLPLPRAELGLDG